MYFQTKHPTTKELWSPWINHHVMPYIQAYMGEASRLYAHDKVCCTLKLLVCNLTGCENLSGKEKKKEFQ